MAGYNGTRGGHSMSSVEQFNLDLIQNAGKDDHNKSLDITLSEQLDIEVHKVEMMVKCLEYLERTLEPTRNNDHTTLDNYPPKVIPNDQVT